MVSDHHRNIVPLIPVAAHAGDAFLAVSQVFRRGRAERADGLGANGQQLAREELAADLHLVRLRRAVFRRAAFHHVADVDILAQQRNAFFFRGAFDHLRQQLARAADERDTLRVFIRARTFAYEDQFGLLVAHAEDDFGALFVQAAAMAIANVVEDAEEGFTFGDFGNAPL